MQFFLTSPESPEYNCVAWAANDTSRWWWPVHGPHREAYWPPDVARKEEIPAFIAAFAKLGYEPCPDGAAERGFEKVALFADAQGKPRHVARQLPNGTWSSKLGVHEDISHIVFGLEGGPYGTVVQYLKRKKPSEPVDS
ncbi:MAG: DUF7689 domain-containing protein [Gemmatimonadales bacterium]